MIKRYRDDRREPLSWDFCRHYEACHCLCDNVVVAGLWWDEEDADYIRRRSERYPGALNIEPEWTLEAAADPRAIVRDPDPKSRTGAIRLIGYSPSAGFVLTVIIDAVDWAGITAWKARGVDLRSYLEGEVTSDG
jgi:hypothetical protein